MRESDQPLHSHFNLVLKIGSLADGNINSHLSKACGARSLHGPPAPSAPWSFLSATRPFSHFSTRPLIACLGQSILVMQPVGSLRSTELNSRSSELRTQLGVVSWMYMLASSQKHWVSLKQDLGCLKFTPFPWNSEWRQGTAGPTGRAAREPGCTHHGKHPADRSYTYFLKIQIEKQALSNFKN